MMSDYQQDTQKGNGDEGMKPARSSSWRARLGRRLARIPFASAAITDQADLSEFREPPTLRVILGVFTICLSFVICWPAITAIGAFSAYVQRPWILAIGGPILYGLSHLCFIAGMLLSGKQYTWVFLRWATRVGVEKLLAEDGVGD